MKCAYVDSWPSGVEPEETAKRTRSMTAIYGLERLRSILPDDEHVIYPIKHSNDLCNTVLRGAVYAVHIVGADFVEARPDALSLFAELTHWIARYHYQSFIQRYLRIPEHQNMPQELSNRASVVVEYLLVGPSLPVQFNGAKLEEEYDVSIPSTDPNESLDLKRSIHVNSKLVMISSTYDTCTISTGAQDGQSSSLSTTPSFYMLYHPGIWGYDSWKPTLRYIQERCRCTLHHNQQGETEGDLCNSIINHHRTPPVFVTSFNEFEADDDCECIDEILTNSNRLGEANGEDSGSGKPLTIRWLFKPIQNPFASRVMRPSHGIEGRVCMENSFIQCFQGADVYSDEVGIMTR
eukprot:Tbor_TRINITY_DN4713_c0_g2::TRINITY_DN4713_c0_g2_i1::g.17195::m.17195